MGRKTGSHQKEAANLIDTLDSALLPLLLFRPRTKKKDIGDVRVRGSIPLQKDFLTQSN